MSTMCIMIIMSIINLINPINQSHHNTNLSLNRSTNQTNSTINPGIKNLKLSIIHPKQAGSPDRLKTS